MLGDSNVGKSSLLYRFEKNKFNENMIGTTGIDFRQKFVTVGDKKIKLEIFDSAGQEKFKSLSNKFY